MSLLLVCVNAVLEKKLEFLPIDPIPRVRGGRRGGGGRRGEIKIKFRHVRASHTLLGKLALFPHRPQIP